MCGKTTGGQDECYFDCKRVPCLEGFDIIVEDLTCLTDCFENTADSCAAALLTDVINNGVCFDIGLDLYPVNDSCIFSEDGFVINQGTCSPTTESLLTTTECLQEIYSKPVFIWNTLTNIITLSCTDDIVLFHFDFQVNNSLAGEALLGRRSCLQIKPQLSNKSRLAPAQVILETADFGSIYTKLNFENTRHRYPWVCSLRSKGPNATHQCAVNLLSIPPNPTVLVGAAHCTYLCKDGSRDVPVCCCSRGVEDCRGRDLRCGDNPGVVEMTASDSVIRCGEWDISQASSQSTGEQYNIELPIVEIVRHPGYDPVKGVINGNDIVVFKVNDRNLQNGIATRFQVWPACLPPEKRDSMRTGIHAGWPQPPPFPFLQAVAPGYARFYDNFYKQWHYKMDILDKCEDPKESPICTSYEFPSNSSYPAGSVCARDITLQSCFSTGDSGSPLMISDDRGRRYIEGVLSFVRGCDQFDFVEIELESSTGTTWVLSQRATNPSAYTKLSCFLPWVAAQYNMVYESAGVVDQACTTATGDPNDSENTCTNTLSNVFGLFEEVELECIFPFYFNGTLYNECIPVSSLHFVYPVSFSCPIRPISTLNETDGIISFNFNGSEFVNGYCISEQQIEALGNDVLPENQYILDPNYDGCSSFNRRPPMSQCKNNCPGARAFGIIGGGVALGSVATASVLGSLQVALPAAAVVGAAGVGGSMLLSQNSCPGPFYCTSILDGRCCLVTLSRNGVVCPDTCA